MCGNGFSFVSPLKQKCYEQGMVVWQHAKREMVCLLSENLSAFRDPCIYTHLYMFPHFIIRMIDLPE